MDNLLYERRWEKYDTEEKGIASDCKKCGCRQNPFSYHGTCYSRYSEHLHFTCSRCGYDWTGNTIDNQSSAE